MFKFGIFFKYYLNININFLLNSYVLQLIKKYNIDLWHFNFLNFKSLILINILKNFNQKIIVTFLGIDVQVDKSISYGYRNNKKYDEYLKQTLCKIDKFSYLSNTIKKDLIELGVDEKKLVYFPNCVDVNKFQKTIVKKS